MTRRSRSLGEHIRDLAAFAHDWRTVPLPTEADEFGRLLLLDTVGALVGATRYPPVQAMIAHLGSGIDSAGPTPFSLLFRLGTAATWLDTDSGGSFHPQGHRLPPVPTAHPGPHVLPVLLQHAALGVPDADLTRAFVLSVEIGMRFGTATSLRPGLHPHGIHGTVAAAAAESLLRGHDPELLAAAMTRALTTPVAARLWQPVEGGTVRNAWTGLGTYYGARAGAEAAWRPPAPAEAAEAAMRTVFTPELDLDLLSDGLGSRWAFLDSYLKPYACARWIHPALDAVLLALSGDRAGQGASGIAAIEVETFAFATSLRARTPLRSDLHARFDLPTCIATIVLDGELHAPAFLPDRLARHVLTQLAGAVIVHERDDYTAALPAERPASVTVAWIDGHKTHGTVRNARGNPDDPLSSDEVVAKFRANTDTILSPQTTEGCIALLADGRPSEDAVLAAVARTVS